MGIVGTCPGIQLEVPPDFPPGNFWHLIEKNESMMKGTKMENVEENEVNMKKRKKMSGKK